MAGGKRCRLRGDYVVGLVGEFSRQRGEERMTRSFDVESGTAAVGVHASAKACAPEQIHPTSHLPSHQPGATMLLFVLPPIDHRNVG
jgi:hypothetical protein